MGVQTTPKTPNSLGIRLQYFDGSAWYDMTATELKALIDNSSAYQPSFENQVAEPLTGASVTVAPTTVGGNVVLDLRPTGTIATLNLIFPSSNIGSVATVDGQEVVFTTLSTITAIALVGNGATIRNAITTLTSGSFARYRYSANYLQWLRVG